jgi:hypothetical protein
MRCLVYNWRIVLGGVASASVLAVGIAAPTLPRSVSRADDRPASALTGSVPSGSAASGVGCYLPGLPQAGPVVAALAGAPGTLCGSSERTTVPRRATSVLPGLSAVTSAIPGLSDLSGLSDLPGLGSVTGATSRVSGSQVGAGSLTGRLAAASAVTGALSGLGGAFGGAQLGSQQP